MQLQDPLNKPITGLHHVTGEPVWMAVGWPDQITVTEFTEIRSMSQKGIGVSRVYRDQIAVTKGYRTQHINLLFGAPLDQERPPRWKKHLAEAQEYKLQTAVTRPAATRPALPLIGRDRVAPPSTK